MHQIHLPKPLKPTVALTPQEALQQYWGYAAFRPLQLDIIESVLGGRDTLALLPTGGGKSICFQVPAMVQEGICIVVSPLIALMKDQVQNLQKRGISAVAVYSGLSYRDIDRLLDNCVHGNVNFLYVSPERLTTELVIERVKRMNVNLLAVDEAHCISQWGYDFRPPYLKLSELRNFLPKVPILALTATATPQVVVDIQQKLAFRGENVFQQNFERENLAYITVETDSKFARMVDLFKKSSGSGIVYTRSRRATQELSDFLGKRGISADFYHAGLPANDRSRKQDDWVQGKTRVMVATNAFGMGIDKANVRLVVHWEPPDSLEAYFQEAGRAGRDGQRAHGVLLFDHTDLERLRERHESAFPSWKQVQQVYQALGNHFQLAIGSGKEESFDFDMVTFAKNYRFDPYGLLFSLKMLEHANWITLTDAVNTPAQVFFTLSKEKIYDFILKNKPQERLIQFLLRSYQGIYSHLVPINLFQMANHLKISREQVIQTLQLLHKEQILEFHPEKDVPQLTFVRERVAAENLTYDRDRFLFLKKRHLHQIESVIEYTTKLVCRSQLLLAYFGQAASKPCGQCDVCMDWHSDTLSDEELRRFSREVRDLVRQYSLTMPQLLAAFHLKDQKKVLKVLNFLKENGWLQNNGSFLVWKQ